MTLIERQISKVIFCIANWKTKQKSLRQKNWKICKQIGSDIILVAKTCHSKALRPMRLNPNYKHNQQAFGFPSLHMHLAMYILSALVNICSQAVKINWRFNFFRGLSNCLQNSFIAYRRWQWVCECVFVFDSASAWKRWTLISWMFAKCTTNFRGEMERIDSQSAKATMFQCCTLHISTSTFFAFGNF